MSTEPAEARSLPDRRGRGGRFHAIEDANEYIGILRAAHIEQVRRLRAENEALRAEANTQAEQTVIARAERDQLRHDAMTVYGIVYEQLTAGIVDDHDRIMRATNELAEAGRRFAGATDEEKAT